MYVCSKAVFNLSKRALSETEIQVLKKQLDFDLVQRSITQPELRKDFEEFSIIKWNFRDEISNEFSQSYSLRSKSY